MVKIEPRKPTDSGSRHVQGSTGECKNHIKRRVRRG